MRFRARTARTQHVPVRDKEADQRGHRQRRNWCRPTAGARCRREDGELGCSHGRRVWHEAGGWAMRADAPRSARSYRAGGLRTVGGFLGSALQ